MGKDLRIAVLLLLACAAFALPARAASYANWGAIIVAGDDHAHDGSFSKVFDNGRHDIGEALQRIGFRGDNIEEFSVDSSKYSSPTPEPSDPQLISNALWDLANRTSGGCLLYFTSHGSPDGVVVGNDILSPGTLSHVVNNACGDRPTIVIVSSCFSGVFVPALKGPNRLVLSAARPDRTSFGCGQADRYTYFDQCFLESIGGAHDFPTLGTAIQSCVRVREVEDDVAPPSQPQLSVGSTVAANLPKW